MATQQSFFTLTAAPSCALDALPACEHPLNRVYEVGAAYASLTELLAVIIGGPQQVEAAQRVIEQHERLPTALAPELETIPGIGKVKAARIVAALELGKRLAQPQPDLDVPQVRSPSDAEALLIPWIGHQEQECFAVLYLNTRNRVIGKEILYRGTLNCSLVRAAEVFRGAIRRNCASLMVSHNHPSGDPSPSPEDIALTRRLVQAGRMMEVDLLDHIIVGRNRALSLRERYGDVWETRSEGDRW